MDARRSELIFIVQKYGKEVKQMSKVAPIKARVLDYRAVASMVSEKQRMELPVLCCTCDGMSHI